MLGSFDKNYCLKDLAFYLLVLVLYEVGEVPHSTILPSLFYQRGRLVVWNLLARLLSDW